MSDLEEKRISTAAINITNGLMNVMTAALMQPETEEDSKKMLDMCKEGTKCFGKALNLLDSKTKILTADPKAFINGLNIYDGGKK